MKSKETHFVMKTMLVGILQNYTTCKNKYFYTKKGQLDLSQTTQRVNYEHIRSGGDPFNVLCFRRTFHSNLHIKQILGLFYSLFDGPN